MYTSSVNFYVFSLLVGGLLFLILGGEFLVRGATRLAQMLGISPIVIGLTVVAFGTSTPELAVSLKAAFDGNANIAIANVVGSNIFNTLFILGICGLISPLIIHSQVIRREVPLMVAASAVLLLLSFGGVVSQVEGCFLFASLIAYTLWLIRDAKRHRAENQELERESVEKFQESPQHAKLWKVILLIATGLAFVMLGANWLVFSATEIARALGVSDTVIGLTIVAAGTSLPEVMASIVATYKGERDIAIGNVVGSNIYNILAIVGLSGAIVPGGLQVDPAMLNFDIPLMILAAAICWPFFKTGKRLSRPEAIVFLAAYAAYTAHLIYK